MNVPPVTAAAAAVATVPPPLAALGFPPAIVPQFSIPPPGFVAPPPPELAAAFGAIPPNTEWTEHKAPDGRSYYYNNVTKQSSWDKPELLMNAAEKLKHHCPWKEYTSETGKIYYHNVTTKESCWDPPAEFLEMQTKVKAEEAAAAAKAVAAMTSSSLVGIVPPVALTNILPVSLPSSGSRLSPPDVQSPLTPGSNENSSSALDQAMAATLASIEMPTNNREDKENKIDSPEESKTTFKDKREAIEAFKELLREKNVSSNATWDQCVKIISKDPRYNLFKNLNEKKQTFNAYKTQKLKDEKEEARIKAKKAKEDLEKFLMTSDKMNSTMKYYKCEELFATNKIWTSVPEQDRRDIFEDCIFNLSKREREETRLLNKRNIKVLGELLESMSNIIYSTTWAEAQVMLLENSAFKNDVNLLGMDKEDALIVFEEHIRTLEREEDEEREREKKRMKRQQRKNRDAFLALLDSLHEEGKLTSMSLWVELYPLISADLRFSAMLGQNGSTPLDLFKFFVEDLKARYHEEKKIIREILKAKEFTVQVNTSFEDFATVVCEDKRSAALDAGNVKLTYNSMLEKAEAIEKDRLKEETKRLRKLENEIKAEWMEANVSIHEPYEVAQKLVEHLESYAIYEKEFGVRKVWDDYIKESEDACSHHHSKSHKTKKNKKHKKRLRSSSKSDMENDLEEFEKIKKRKSKSRSPSISSTISTESDHISKKKKKRKNKKFRESSCESLHELSTNGSSTAAMLMNLDDITCSALHKKKKKDKKNKKDKERNKHHYHHHHHHHHYQDKQRSGTSLSPSGSNISDDIHSPISSHNDASYEQALSESELESKRAALLAQLNEQMEE